MNLCSILRAIAFGAILALCPNATAADRSLVQVKAAAEAGNPQAQYDFAQSCAIGGAEWSQWMLAAAKHNHGPAQDALAWHGGWAKFATHQPTPGNRTAFLKANGATMQQSLIWAAHAADKGFDRSKMILGFAYLRGYFVRKDEIESLKWFSLVRSVSAVESVYLNQARRTLAQSMTPDQVREVTARAAQHEPGGTIQAILREIVATNTQLSALSRNSNRSLAMLNDVSVAAGSEVTLTLNDLPVTVRCLRIGTDSVDLAVPPDTTPITFRIGATTGAYTPPRPTKPSVASGAGNPAAPVSAASKSQPGQSQARHVAQQPSPAPVVEPPKARKTGVEPFIWLTGILFVIVVAKGSHSLLRAKAKAGAARSSRAGSKPAPTPELASPGRSQNGAVESAHAVPKWSLTLLRELEWKRFEELTAAYFREQGFAAKTTRIGADGGVDVELYLAGQPRPEALVQCKAWNNYTVGVKPVRELFGVMAADRVTRGVLITTSTFTEDARDFVRGKSLELIDGETFLDRILALSPEAQARLLACATAGDYTTPSCPSCGDKMVLRTAAKGRNTGDRFWGCRYYPRCKQKIPVRANGAG